MTNVYQNFFKENKNRSWIIAFVVCSCALILSFVIYDQVLRRGVEYEFHEFQSGDRTVAAVIGRPTNDYAKGSLPGVVVFHGLIASKEWMLDYVHAVANAGMFVMAVDLAGHGANNGLLSTLNVIEDGLSALDHLKTFAEVDPTRLGMIGWSMGGQVAGLNVASLRTPADGLKSVVLIGVNLGFNGFDWNSQAPANMLLAVGINDELVDPKNAKEAVSKITEGYSVDNQIEFDTAYGQFANFTARKLYIGTTNHITEPIDNGIIKETVSWLQQSLGSGATPQDFNYNGIMALNGLGSFGGLMAIGLLCLALTFPLFKKAPEVSSEVITFRYRAYWWVVHNTLWLGCLIAGFVANFIPLPVQFYFFLIGAFFVGAIVFFVYYWRVCHGSSLKAALLAPFHQTTRRSSLILLGVFLLWLIVMQAIFYNVPWMFGFGTPLFKSLNILNPHVYRYVIMVILWIPTFVCWVYETAIVRYYTCQAWEGAGIKLSNAFRLRLAFEILASRLWTFVLLLVGIVICIAGAQARVLGDFAIMVSFLYPLVAYMFFISIITIVTIFSRRNGPVEMAIIFSGLLSYYIASILPFGYGL